MREHGPQSPSKDLGGFSTDSFEKINEKGGQFAGEAPPRAMGASAIPVAGETCADAAIAQWAKPAGGRIDKTNGGKAVSLPTQAGGPLPQDTPKGV